MSGNQFTELLLLAIVCIVQLRNLLFPLNKVAQSNLKADSFSGEPSSCGRSLSNLVGRLSRLDVPDCRAFGESRELVTETEESFLSTCASAV
jgi:hypothetical protein